MKSVYDMRMSMGSLPNKTVGGAKQRNLKSAVARSAQNYIQEALRA